MWIDFKTADADCDGWDVCYPYYLRNTLANHDMLNRTYVEVYGEVGDNYEINLRDNCVLGGTQYVKVYREIEPIEERENNYVPLIDIDKSHLIPSECRRKSIEILTSRLQ
jgi:hypothetical protein